jgi:hypothetical protein
MWHHYRPLRPDIYCSRFHFDSTHGEWYPQHHTHHHKYGQGSSIALYSRASAFFDLTPPDPWYLFYPHGHVFNSTYSPPHLNHLRLLTIFDIDFFLSQESRLLTAHEPCEGKFASFIVIPITHSKVQNIAKRPHLLAFLSTFRLEGRVQFNYITQCTHCQEFSHHVL